MNNSSGKIRQKNSSEKILGNTENQTRGCWVRSANAASVLQQNLFLDQGVREFNRQKQLRILLLSKGTCEFCNMMQFVKSWTHFLR